MSSGDEDLLTVQHPLIFRLIQNGRGAMAALSEPHCGSSYTWRQKPAHRHGSVLVDMPMQAIFQNPKADPQKLMDEACARVNRNLMGRVSPQEMRWKRPLAWLIVIAMLSMATVVVTRQVRQVALSQAGASADSRVAARRGIKVQFKPGCSCCRPCCRC